MRHLEFENQLIRDLIGRGATPAEAQRLSALAAKISRTKLAIDPTFADSLETLLLRERPGEALAQIIAITRTLDAAVYRQQARAMLYAVPAQEVRRSPARLALGALVAAAVALALIVLFAVVGIAHIGRSDPGSKPYVQQKQTPRVQRAVQEQAPSRIHALESHPNSVPAPAKERGDTPPVPESEVRDPGLTPSQVCPVANGKNLHAGAKPLSANCSVV